MSSAAGASSGATDLSLLDRDVPLLHTAERLHVFPRLRILLCLRTGDFERNLSDAHESNQLQVHWKAYALWSDLGIESKRELISERWCFVLLYIISPERRERMQGRSDSIMHSGWSDCWDFCNQGTKKCSCERWCVSCIITPADRACNALSCVASLTKGMLERVVGKGCWAPGG